MVVITMNLIRFLADDTFKRSFSTGLSVADEADFKVCFLKAIKTKYMNIHDETSQLKKCMFDKVSGEIPNEDALISGNITYLPGKPFCSPF